MSIKSKWATSMWIEKFIQYLRYERNYSPRTEISYFRDLTQFKEFVTGEQVEKQGGPQKGKRRQGEDQTKGDQQERLHPGEVDQRLIRQWLATLMEEGLTARTVNRKLSAVKSFYRYLQKQGVVEYNVAERIPGPKASKRLPSFVNPREMSALLDDETLYPDDFRGIRDRFLIELLYVTGMRRAELIALKDSDIDLHASTLKVTGKGNKQRIIPFSNETREKLQNYRKVRDENIKNKTDFLFVKEDGGPLYPKLVYNIVHTYLGSIPTQTKKSPHVLRHSFATGMLNNGAELNAVKELLGHASLASTEVYTHVTFEEMKKTYKLAHPRAKTKEE